VSFDKTELGEGQLTHGVKGPMVSVLFFSEKYVCEGRWTSDELGIHVTSQDFSGTRSRSTTL